MKYPLSTRILHWLVAPLVLFMLWLGIYMVRFLPTDSPNHLQIYELHKSLGVLVFFFVIIRILNRAITNAPPLPSTINIVERILAHLGHFGTYVLLVLVPVSGYLMSASFGFPVHFFSIEIPSLVERNFENAKLFSQLHTLLAYALLIMLIIHVLAVIRHRYFDQPENDVLKRMI